MPCPWPREIIINFDSIYFFFAKDRICSVGSAPVESTNIIGSALFEEEWIFAKSIIGLSR